MPPPSNTRSARSSSSSPSGRRKGKTWFLGIGINRYQYFPPLNNAVKDVEDIKNLLLEKYELDAEQLRLLLDEAATRDNIFDELDRLIEEILEEDKLILYYSGHGHLSAVNGFWIPCEAQKNKTSHYINNSSIRDYVKAIKARHILLISDSCFSGSLFVRGAGRSGEVGLEDMESIPSRWALCSGRHDEEVYDGEPGKNSPFAESILDALRDNQYQSFNVAKLAVRVVEQTRSNYRQLPEGSPLQGVGHKGGQFVFWLKRREADDWAACQNEGTLAAYRGFLLKYPDSRFREEARQNIAFLEEENAWRTARSAHTLAAYYRYDRQYPQGRYTQQSLEIIAELEEEAAWKKARLRHTFSSYRKYTLDYPQGRYQKEAEEKIEEIAAGQQEPNFWRQTAEKDTPAAYEDYLKRYPKGQYRVEAQNRLTQLQEIQAENTRRQQKQKEAADWAVVEKSSSLQNLKNYLKNYSQGKHAVEARQRLSALEGEPRQAKTPRLQKHIRWAAPLLLLLILAVWGAPKLLSSGDKALKTALIVFQDKATQKYGFQDADGNTVIAADFEEALAFIGDKAQVKKDGQSFYIDAKGKCVQDCPDGKTEILSPEADAKAWIAALETDDKAAYQDYQNRFPQGEYYEQAAEKIRDFEEAEQAMLAARNDEQAWQAAVQKKTVAAYKGYRQSYPEGKYYVEAAKQIRQLQKAAFRAREEKAWKAAQQLGTLAAYEKFRREYPKSNYDRLAKEQIGKLEAEAQKTPGASPSKDLGLKTIVLNKQTWLAENLNIYVDDSWCYDGKDENCKKYGRLYTWAAAKKGCAALGSGWRLPTDREWRDMAKQFGGVSDDASDNGATAYKALINGGRSGFAALLGGRRNTDGSYYYQGVYGYYWSGTERGASDAWGYNFNYGKLYRNNNRKSYAFSVRCLQD